MPRTKTISDEELLRFAREVFLEKGIQGSTREIARRAGISEGVLFQRYSTKADLFFAAMVPPSVELESYLKPAGKDLPPEPASVLLERFAWAMLAYYREAAPVLLVLMTHPEFRFEHFAVRHPDSSLVLIRDQVMRFFLHHRIPNPGGAALAFMTSTFGIAAFERMGAHGGHMPESLVEDMIATLVRGTLTGKVDHAGSSPPPH